MADLNAVEQALADIRAIPTTTPEAETQTRSSAGCCTGDRRGYQWHQRTGNLPACEDARTANAAYMAPYTREWKHKRGSRRG